MNDVRQLKTFKQIPDLFLHKSKLWKWIWSIDLTVLL